MWVEDGKINGKDQNFPIYNTLEKTVEAAILLSKRDMWIG